MRQIHIKEAAVARTRGAPRLLVCGDSSVAFGMDPAVLTKTTGMPAINLGYTAGCGALALLGVGDYAAESGDTLVLSIVPGIVSKAPAPEPEGRVLAMMYGRPRIAAGGREPLIPYGVTEHLRTYSGACAPGFRLLLNDAGRFALRMPGFRYEDCAIDDWGYYSGKVIRTPTPAEDILPVQGAWHPVLTAWSPALKEFVSRMRSRGVQIVYTLPWIYCSKEAHARAAAHAKAFMDEMSDIMPVVEEPDLGIKLDAELFSDTDVHLTVEGARERSRILGKMLKTAGMTP